MSAGEMRAVGMRCYNGTPKDPAGAFKWFLKAAEQGDVPSMLEVGVMAESGDGTELSAECACTWYGKAARARHTKHSPEACIKAASYLIGKPTPGRGPDGKQQTLKNVDGDAALALYEIGGEIGDMWCMWAGGNLLLTGAHGNRRSPQEGVAWLIKASDAGHPDAPLTVALVYAGFTGAMPRDEQKMLKWYTTAVDRGEDERLKDPMFVSLFKPVKCKDARGRRDESAQGGEEAAGWDITKTVYMGAITCAACGKQEQAGEKYAKCAGCKRVVYCTRGCQKQHWKQGGHRQECNQVAATAAKLKDLRNTSTQAPKPAQVPATCTPPPPRTGSGIEGITVDRGWASIYLSSAEFGRMLSSFDAADAPAVPFLLGLPQLVVHRHTARGGGDNQIITYLMIEEHGGFAAHKWQGGVGPCTVVRADGHPYTAEDHEVLHDYLSRLLDQWGDEDVPTRATSLNPRAFQRHVRSHIDSRYLYSKDLCPLEKYGTVLAPRVRLRGLTTASLNGTEGFRGRWNASKERYSVHLDSGRDILAKPSNLQPVEEDNVQYWTTMVLEQEDASAP